MLLGNMAVTLKMLRTFANLGSWLGYHGGEITRDAWRCGHTYACCLASRLKLRTCVVSDHYCCTFMNGNFHRQGAHNTQAGSVLDSCGGANRLVFLFLRPKHERNDTSRYCTSQHNKV